MQGGATLQFSCVPFNLGKSNQHTAHYIVTGEWTRKARHEATRLGLPTVSHDAKDPIVVPENASYILYCSNETIDGVKCNDPILINPFNVPVVCDMSSDIFTRKIDINDFGLIFAGAQKNMGCSGMTLVIVRNDLLDLKHNPAPIPVMMDYALMQKHKSMYNTPSTFSIYVCGLVMAYYIQLGGLEVLEVACNLKSDMFYRVLDASCGFYCAVVMEERWRSRVNIVFRIKRGLIDCEKLENKFIQEAEDENMIQLRGHRSVGGIRASFYNACPMEDLIYLIEFMHRFQKNNDCTS